MVSADVYGEDSATDACIQSHYAGQVAQRDGRLREAREAFARCSSVDCPGVIRQECNALADEVRRQVPTVVLGARSSAGDELRVRVSIDGVVVAESLDGTAMEVDVGQQVFRFEHPDYEPVEMTVVIRAGEKMRSVTAELEASSSAAPPPVSGTVPAPPPGPQHETMVIEEPGAILWPTYVAGGLALAGLGVFIGFGAKGVAARADLLEATDGCAPFCTDEELSGVRRDFVVADVGLGVALAATATAVLLFVLRPTEKREVRVMSVGVAPIWSADAIRGGNVGIGGSF